MKKKHILIVLIDLKSGGAERQMLKLAEAGKNRGHSISLLLIKKNDQSTINGMPVSSLGQELLTTGGFFKKAWNRIRIIFAIRSFINKGTYECTILYIPFLKYLPLLLRDTRLVMSLRTFDKKHSKMRNIFFYKQFDILTVNSLANYLQLASLHPRLRYVRNIIPPPAPGSGIKVNKKILIVSNIMEHKNIFPAVRAMKSLEGKGFELNIAGTIAQNNYYKRIKTYIKNKGLQKINFTGFVSHKELAKLYEQSEIIVHISKAEGTANAILDAIRYGKPFIVLRTSENMEIVKNIEEFIIDDDSELADKIMRIHDDCVAENKGLIQSIKYLQDRLRFEYSPKNGDIFYSLLEKSF